MKKLLSVCSFLCISAVILYASTVPAEQKQPVISTPATAPFFTEKIPYAKYLPADKLTVVVTFDGGKSAYRWKDILNFSKKNNVKCTFFVSGVYFIPDAQSNTYIDPRDCSKRGNSIIGFGGTQKEVNERIALIKEAVAEGHDVESHLNGHFDGTRWTKAMWLKEFDEYSTITAPCLPRKAEHVRFPSLTYNSNVYSVMAQYNIKSITSVYSKDTADFIKINVMNSGNLYTLYEFPIPVKTENGTRLIMMDYNFFQYDTIHHVDSAKAQSDMTAMYLAEADTCFKEHRPFFMSHHFTNFNHAAYWQAMKSVIQTLNNTYHVQYLTVSDLCAAVSK